MTAEGYFPKVDGDIFYASEVNSLAFIGTATSSTNTTEYSEAYTSPNTYDNKTSITFTPPSASSIILFVKVEVDIKGDGSNYAYVRVRSGNFESDPNNANPALLRGSTWHLKQFANSYDTKTGYYFFGKIFGYSDVEISDGLAHEIQPPASSHTFYVDLGTESVNGGTAYMKNITLTVYWLETTGNVSGTLTGSFGSWT